MQSVTWQDKLIEKKKQADLSQDKDYFILLKVGHIQ